MGDTKIYKIQLTDDQLNELERLAALNYTSTEMAMYFDVSAEDFINDIKNPDSVIKYHIERGKLISKAKEKLSLLDSAEEGNITASQQLNKLRAIENFAKSRRNYIYDDEKDFQRLYDYIEKGSSDNLEEDEEIYLDVLTLMVTMNRKYGRRKTVNWFMGPPFNLSRHRSNALFDRAVDYFYADENIDRKAIRNMRAEMIIDGAMVVLQNASSAKDFEIYANMIIAASKLQQLDMPDPIEIPRGLYDKPIKLYMLDPKAVGITNINRNELANQIDELPVPESVKRRVKQDAMIIDIEFEETLNEFEKENKTE